MMMDIKPLRKNKLQGINVLTPKLTSWYIKKAALNHLIFLKGKHCGKLNTRGCADGQPQQEYISKEQTSSPMVLLYVLMGSYVMNVMDVMDHHEVNTVIVLIFQEHSYNMTDHKMNNILDTLCLMN